MFSAISAFLLPFKGLSLIFSSGLKRYVLVPLLVNIVLYVAIAWIAVDYFDVFLNWLLPPDSWLEYFRWLLWPLFTLTYAILSFYTFTILANLIASPFNGLLAARVEYKLTGQHPPEPDKSVLAAVVPALVGELQKLLYLLTRAVPLLILMLIPGVNAVASILWIILGFWFLAMEYGDYPMGNYAMMPKEQRKELRARPIQAIVFGVGVSAIMLIPVLNFAAMPASVAAATMMWVNNRKRSSEMAGDPGS